MELVSSVTVGSQPLSFGCTSVLSDHVVESTLDQVTRSSFSTYSVTTLGKLHNPSKFSFIKIMLKTWISLLMSFTFESKI